MKYIIGLIVVLLLGLGGYFAWQKSHEHPGTAVGEHPGSEHPGSEHPGDKAKDEEPSDENNDDEEMEEQEMENHEHPGDKTDEHPGSTRLELQKNYSALEIKTAMKAYIQSKTNSKTLDGTFQIYDDQEQKMLTLRFSKIHDPVRILKNKGYFACTDFEVVGEPGRLYDLDFWLNPKAGNLVVTEQKVHKHPADNQGNKTARYTFKDEEIVDLQ